MLQVTTTHGGNQAMVGALMRADRMPLPLPVVKPTTLTQEAYDDYTDSVYVDAPYDDYQDS